MIEVTIQNALANNAGVSALVGTQIHYSEAPQNTPSPYIVMTKISAPRDYTHDGPSGLVKGRFQFSIFAATYTLTKQVAAAIKPVLENLKCWCDDETDLGRDPSTGFYHLAVDYQITYNE